MPKTVYLTESQLRTVLEEELSKSEVEKIAKSEVVSTIKKDRDVEKRIKEISADVIKTLFRTLWQKNNLYDGELRK